MFIRADADPEHAAAVLTFGLRWNGGATCIAPRRVLVAEPVAGALAAHLARRVEALPPVPLPEVWAERARRWLGEAVAGGARVLAGGVAPASCGGFRATVVSGVPEGARILREEVLAPVLFS